MRPVRHRCGVGVLPAIFVGTGLPNLSASTLERSEHIDGWQGTVTGNCQKCGYEYLYGATDRTKLEAVLGTDAYNQLYKKKNGAIRNRLMHGHPINEDDAAALCDTIYKQILRYLKDTLELKTIEEIVGAPRRFDSLQWFGAFLRLKERIPPSLHELEQNWQQLGDWVDQPPAY